MSRVKTFTNGGTLLPGDLNGMEDYVDSAIAALSGDPRIPTQTENDALAGVGGAPSSSNPFVTDAAPRLRVLGSAVLGIHPPVSSTTPAPLSGAVTVTHTANRKVLVVAIIGLRVTCNAGSTPATQLTITRDGTQAAGIKGPASAGVTPQTGTGACFYRAASVPAGPHTWEAAIAPVSVANGSTIEAPGEGFLLVFEGG